MIEMMRAVTALLKITIEQWRTARAVTVMGDVAKSGTAQNKSDVVPRYDSEDNSRQSHSGRPQ